MNDDPLLKARYKYIRYSIVSEYSFLGRSHCCSNTEPKFVTQTLQSWFTSVEKDVHNGSAIDYGPSGSLAIGGIFDQIDPSKNVQINISSALTALKFGLNRSADATFDPHLVDLVTNTIENTTVLKTAFWASSSTHDTGYISNTQILINDILNRFKMDLQAVLDLIQGVNQPDPSLFLAIAGQGDFTVPQAGIPRFKASGKLALPLTTYLLTTALVHDNWTALILPGVDALGVQNGTQDCPPWASTECRKSPDIGCRIKYDSFGRCLDTSWWYSDA